MAGSGKLEFMVAGAVVQVNHLSDEMDYQFKGLHAAMLAGGTLDLAGFSAAVSKYLDTPGVDWRDHDRYFENFTVLWQRLLAAGDPLRAEKVWSIALQPVLAWEAANPGRRVHKGVPFYFAGSVALAAGDLDKGYALVHQALAEDTATHGAANVDTPALALAALDWEKTDQAFRQWVLRQRPFLSALVGEYNSSRARSLTLEKVQAGFLRKSGNADESFLLAYVLARLIALTEIPISATRNSFIAQLQLNLLFDLTLVIDAAAKPLSISEWKFVDRMECLSRRAGLSLARGELRAINEAFKADFEGTLRALLEGTLSLQGRASPTGLESDVALAYGIRNRGAHHVASVELVAERFQEISQAVFNVLFLSIELLV